MRAKTEKYSDDQIERIIERVAAGATLTAIVKEDGMPTAATVRARIVGVKRFRDLWDTAKSLRASCYFDEALDISRRLSDKALALGEETKWSKEDTNNVAALRISIDTLKFAAARLDPASYGERAVGTPIVPIQINTTLSLGQDGRPPAETQGDVYTLRATVPLVLDAIPQASAPPSSGRGVQKDSQ